VTNQFLFFRSCPVPGVQKQASCRGSEITKAITGAAWWRQGAIYQIYPRSFQDTNGDGIDGGLGIRLCELLRTRTGNGESSLVDGTREHPYVTLVGSSGQSMSREEAARLRLLRTVTGAVTILVTADAGRWLGAAPIVSAISLHGFPVGLLPPVSLAVWCSEFSSVPEIMTIVDSHIHIIRPIAAPCDP
jgi:hypothetical protein